MEQAPLSRVYPPRLVWTPGRSDSNVSIRRHFQCVARSAVFLKVWRERVLEVVHKRRARVRAPVKFSCVAPGRRARIPTAWQRAGRVCRNPTGILDCPR